LEKDKLVSEDDWRRGQDQVQKITDRYIAQIDEILQSKEHEVMEV
jgi:ribosome recycling factor